MSSRQYPSGTTTQAGRKTVFPKMYVKDPTSTQDEFRQQWSFDGATWTRNAEDEDRLYVMFDIDGATGTGTPGMDDGVGATSFTAALRTTTSKSRYGNTSAATLRTGVVLFRR